MSDVETRVVPAKVELREKMPMDEEMPMDDKMPKKKPKKMLMGYAAMFGVRSEDLGGFVEEIDRGAFEASLEAGDEVLARGEHDSRMLLGKRSSGTLRLETDKKGLAYEVDPPDTQAGRDIMELVARGDISQSSFAFMTVRDRWEDLEDGTVLRTVLEARLIDVAPVAMPAYTQTTVSARALEQAKATRRPAPRPDLELERLRLETA